MIRRSFLQVLGLGGGLMLVRPLPGWARILGGPAPDPTGPVTIDPAVQRFVGSIQVGEASRHGALRVFWLRGAAPSTVLDVLTLDEARARGELSITEREQATVPALLVENRGKAHVVLLAGEILLGGKQNRIVIDDILLPPRSGPLNLAVYCVEQGRWAGSGKAFESRGSVAAPSLRARVMQRAGQGRVWAEVDRYAGQAAAPSPTGSYQAVMDKPEVKAHQREVEAAIDHRVAQWAQGAAVFTGDVLAGLDLFQDSGLFARQWPKLLRAYAVESYGRPAVAAPDEPALRTRAAALLQAIASRPGRVRHTVGKGHLVELEVEGRRGAALVADGQVVHAALL